MKFFNGFWGLLKKIGLRLVQFSPVFVLVFIGYGDSFLPEPLSGASLTTRTKINEFLRGSFTKHFLENDKYDNNRNNEVIEQVEEEYQDGQKNTGNN